MEDPLEMIALEIPGGNLFQQTTVIAEEFRDMGFDQLEVLSMFTNPFYGGMHIATVQLGEDVVNQIVSQVFEKIHVINRQEA